jgi:hypothetical protein
MIDRISVNEIGGASPGMIKKLSQTITATRLCYFVVLLFVLSAAMRITTTVAGIRPSRGRCPPCAELTSSKEDFDGVTPPALPQGWLATNVLGPPPLWITSDSGLPMPPANTAPNAASIDDPDVLSDSG